MLSNLLCLIHSVGLCPSSQAVLETVDSRGPVFISYRKSDGRVLATEKNSARRSAGVLQHRRQQLEWPDDSDFRILSIDGGGIRGIFPAAFLAGLEERFLNGSSVSRYFDLIAGTSTGGVIAIGLGAGLCASELRDLYIRRGDQIFPPAGAITRKTRKLFRYIRYSYNRDGLMRVLSEYLTNRKFGESQNRLCIPSCDGQYGDLYVFKTPHHPDFCMDGREPMVKVQRPQRPRQPISGRLRIERTPSWMAASGPTTPLWSD